MSNAFAFRDPDGLYFITFSVVGWVDVFTRPVYCEIFLDSVRYCQQHKGLTVHAWCLMSSHFHGIVSRRGQSGLSDILRDWKKFTSGTILKAMREEPESRREWMLPLFAQAGHRNANNEKFQFWQQDNHPLELFGSTFIEQKLNYIHNNPVEAGLVDFPEQFRYSSGRDYAGTKGLLEVLIL